MNTEVGPGERRGLHEQHSVRRGPWGLRIAGSRVSRGASVGYRSGFSKRLGRRDARARTRRAGSEGAEIVEAGAEPSGAGQNGDAARS